MPTLVEFFGRELATTARRRAGHAEPRASATTSSRRCPTSTTSSRASQTLLCRRRGTATFEFPHLAAARSSELEYDTIYHEHFSYFSFCDHPRDPSQRTASTVVRRRGALDARGLVARLRPAPRAACTLSARPCPRSWTRRSGGVFATPAPYERFADERQRIEAGAARAPDRHSARRQAGRRLRRARQGQHAAQLLRHPHATSSTTPSIGTRTSKGCYTPGTHIPIHPPERLAETRPDYIVVLPWNLIDEIAAQLAHTSEWGAKLVVPIPRATVIEPGEGAGSASRQRTSGVKVVIFCGGLGVRMGEATQRIPKPMIPVGLAADPLAHHAVVRLVGTHGLHPLPRLPRARSSSSTFWTTTRRSRTTSCSRGQRGRAARHGHERLEDHVRRHRRAVRPSASA